MTIQVEPSDDPAWVDVLSVAAQHWSYWASVDTAMTVQPVRDPHGHALLGLVEGRTDGGYQPLLVLDGQVVRSGAGLEAVARFLAEANVPMGVQPSWHLLCEVFCFCGVLEPPWYLPFARSSGNEESYRYRGVPLPKVVYEPSGGLLTVYDVGQPIVWSQWQPAPPGPTTPSPAPVAGPTSTAPGPSGPPGPGPVARSGAPIRVLHALDFSIDPAGRVSRRRRQRLPQVGEVWAEIHEY